MALRHEFPVCSLSVVNRDTDDLRVVRATRRPVTVGFRSGGDISEVTEAMRASRYVSLDAACGAGKSVKVPIMLAAATQKLVVHTIPSRLASLEVAEYVATTTSVNVVYYGDIETDLPLRGVVLMSNAMLVALLLSKPDSFREPFILFMDEAHESDCYTDVVRTLGPNMELVSNFITATATGNVEGFRKKETGGKTISGTFDEINPMEWDIYDDSKPWSVRALSGNTIVFVERAASVKRLRDGYLDAGYDVYALHSRMDEGVYRQAMQAFRSGDNGIVVLLADYSFRSSFTYRELEHVIDTGEVCVDDVTDDGRHIKLVRDAYKLEMEQAAGRAARVPGSMTVVSQAVKPYKSAQAVLEGVEMDAAALLFRMFGYKPPRHLQHLPIASGKVPKDLVQALRSPVPLRCLLESDMVEWVGNLSVLPPLPVVPRIGGRVHKLPQISRVPRAPPREKSPSPPFDESEAVLSVPVEALERGNLSDQGPVVASARAAGTVEAGGGVLDLSRAQTDDVEPLGIGDYVTTIDADVKSALLAKVMAEPRQGSVPPSRDESTARGRSRGHSRAWSEVSALSSASTVDVEPGDGGSGHSHEEFVAAFSKLMETGSDTGISEVGSSYYYHPVADAAVDKCAEFPNGLESVVQFLERDKSGALVRASVPAMRAYMTSVLLDAYNEAVAETRAILRLGSGLNEFSKANAQAVDPGALQLWVAGLSETLHARSVQCKVYAGYLQQIVGTGYKVLPPLTDLESGIIQGHASDLKNLAGEVDAEAGQAYHKSMSSRAVGRTLSGSVAGRLIEADPGTRHVPVADRNRRKAVTAGQVRFRDMKGPEAGGTSVEVGRVAYEIQPSSGLSSIWARPLMKLIGQGEMKVVLK